MIELKNLFKSYGSQEVLKGISYIFDTEKVYVIKGMSGSGKTTLMNILSCIDQTYEGEYLLDQSNTKMLKRENQFGYILQSSLLILNMTVRDNLKMVCDNEEKIQYYAQLFGIELLLDKFPNKLSGGERQRVAIIRALLLDSKVILADEPTASLDLVNANKLALEFAKLRTLNRLVIISTHDNCFDTIADEIIELDYGKIKSVKKNNRSKNEISENKFLQNDRLFKDIDKKYVSLKIKNKKNKRAIAIFTFALTIFILLLGIKSNFKEEYLKLIYDRYPINTFSLNNDQYEQLGNSIDLKAYKNYYYQSKDGIEFFSLPNYEDSIFKDSESMIYGEFPKKKEEILMSVPTVHLLFPDKPLESVIGQELAIDDMIFKVSGIVTDKKDYLSKIMDTNPYYQISPTSLTAFILEDGLNNFGNIREMNEIFVSCKSLYQDKSILPKLENLNVYLYWYNIAESYNTTLNIIFNIILIVITFSSIIIFVFVYHEILLQFYFRRKEIGYFQLFNISKKRIRNMLLAEYYYKYLKIIIYSFILASVISLFVNLVYAINIFPHFIILAPTLILVFIYIIVLVYSPVNKGMKQNIIDLIK